MKNTFQALNPFTNQVIGTYTVTSNTEMKRLNNIAKSGHNSWQDSPLEVRIDKLHRIIDLLKSSRSALIDAQIAEVAMPRREAEESFDNLIHRVSTFFNIDESYFTLKQEYPNNITNVIVRVPYGHVLIVTPWNHPLSIPLWQIIPALLAGNTVIWKPSEKSLSVNDLIYSLFKKLELPPGTFTMIVGGPSQVQFALRNMSVNLLCFTGSLTVGQLLLAQCRKKMLPCIMELGGKDALVVCKDADLDSAVDAAIVGSLRHSGQLCSSIERIFVHESVYDGFVRSLLARTNSIKKDDPNKLTTMVCCLKDETAEQRIANQVKDAVNKGASVLQGSAIRPPEFPIVISKVDSECLLFQEETFGPVIALTSFSRDEELIEKLNDCKYGLCCTIWTKSELKFKELQASIEVGTITLNRLSGTLSRSPWVGRKSSGIGFVLGLNPIEPYTVLKNVRRKAND
ncbi:MAG: aldehyde dehydrogenase family protein [Candidatus Woesearchaeota archaeon]